MVLSERNAPPVVNAGKNQSVNTLDTFKSIQGFAADDVGIQTVEWVKLSGPGEITFSDPNSLISSVSADTAGWKD